MGRHDVFHVQNLPGECLVCVLVNIHGSSRLERAPFPLTKRITAETNITHYQSYICDFIIENGLYVQDIFCGFELYATSDHYNLAL